MTVILFHNDACRHDSRRNTDMETDIYLVYFYVQLRIAEV